MPLLGQESFPGGHNGVDVPVWAGPGGRIPSASTQGNILGFGDPQCLRGRGWRKGRSCSHGRLEKGKDKMCFVLEETNQKSFTAEVLAELKEVSNSNT